MSNDLCLGVREFYKLSYSFCLRVTLKTMQSCIVFLEINIFFYYKIFSFVAFNQFTEK